ncbi:MAG: hypothetical protein V3W37_07945 [Candidatus Binatia bacterium]
MGRVTKSDLVERARLTEEERRAVIAKTARMLAGHPPRWIDLNQMLADAATAKALWAAVEDIRRTPDTLGWLLADEWERDLEQAGIERPEGV